MLIAVIAGCGRSLRVSNLDYSHRYNPEKELLTASVYLSHTDFESTTARIFIPSDELLYLRSSAEGKYISRFSVECMVYESVEQKKPERQLQFSFSDTLGSGENKILVRNFSVPLSLGRNYWVYFKITDLNSRVFAQKLVSVEKTDRFSLPFFSLTSGSDNLASESPFFIPPGSMLNVIYNNRSSFRMQVKKHLPHTVFPTAPYVVDDIKGEPVPAADSTFQVRFTQGRLSFRLPGTGIYLFSEPGNENNGFTVCYFWDSYPSLPLNDNMLYPLRYLTSQEEFTALLGLGNAPLAAERFWTRIAGNPDRGTAVMQRYYSRVEKANIDFVSYIPGWQTDRGMIFIVFGPPDRVFLGDNRESWYYDEAMNFPATEFNFIKKHHPLSKNHYLLLRDPSYRRNWNYAVDKWRR